MTLGEREAADLERARVHLDAAITASKVVLASHLANAHYVQGAVPLVQWTRDELDSEHEDVHRRQGVPLADRGGQA